MLRKKTAVFLVCLLLAAGMLSYTGEAAADGPTVGIAWRADTDSEFYTNVYTALEEAGAVPVLLDQVTDGDLAYTEGRISAAGVAAAGYLTEEYAALVKRNTYRNSNAAAVLRGIDAVVFTGGEDISPTLLALPEDWHGIEEEKDYNATRDVSDYLLMAYCIDNDIPVMGFCRGMQMLGVVSGASVIQDIPTFYAENGYTYRYGHRNEKAAPDDYRDYAPHGITVTDTGSLTCALLGAKTVSGVPSWHHQALKSVEGTKLKVTATAALDGYEIIEAIERTDRTLILGFQFHPEAAVVKHLTHAANADSFMAMEAALGVFTGFLDRCTAEEAAAAA